MNIDARRTRIRVGAASVICALMILANPANGQTRPTLLAPQPTNEQLPPAHVMRENVERSSLTLEHMEGLALANNPTLGGAAALVQQQQGLYVQVGLYPNPTVGYVRSDPDRSGQSQTQGVFVSQDIVTANKLGLARSAQRFEVEHSNWQWQAQRTRILNDVRIRFYETLGAQQAILAAQELERLAVDGVKATEQLLKAKQGSRPDLLQAEIQLSAVRATLRDAQYRHQSAWRQLAAVVGVADLAPAQLKGSLEAGIPAFEWNVLSQKLLADNPLLMAQQADIRAAEYEVRLARAQVIPNVSVQMVAQRDSTDKFSSVSTFVALPIPIFNRNQGNIQSAEGRLLQQRREYERLQLALLDQLAGSYRQYQSLRNQATQLQAEILPRAKENLDLTLQAYKLGKFDFARVLTARQLYFQSNLAYIDALTELHKSSIEITGLQLTGGLNPTEAGTALQAAPGVSNLRGFLLQQLQEQRGSGARNLPGVIQAGNP